MNAIERAVQVTGLKWDELLQKVVLLGSDGASVMTGVQKGIAALLKEWNTCIVSIHCFGHRLKLVYKESLRKGGHTPNGPLLFLSQQHSNLQSSFQALGKKVVIPWDAMGAGT